MHWQQSQRSLYAFGFSRHPLICEQRLMWPLLVLAMVAVANAAEPTAVRRRSLLASTDNSAANAIAEPKTTQKHAVTVLSGSSQADLQGSTAAVAASQLPLDQYFKRGEDLVNLIVVFKHEKHLDVFSPICSRAKRLTRQQQMQRLQNLSKLHPGVKALPITGNSSNDSDTVVGSQPACAALEGSCKHLYKSMIPGFSGKFTRQQFIALQHCAGAGAIDYVERDTQVTKAEEGSYRGWWRNRPPPGTTLQQLLKVQQQQQQQRKASGVSSSNSSANMAVGAQVQALDGALPAATASPQQRQRVHSREDNNSSSTSGSQHTGIVASNNSSSTRFASSIRPGQLWRWVLAEIGLSAQQQLASGNPSITVTAAAGPNDNSTAETATANTLGADTAEGEPVVTAAEDAGGGAGSLQQQQNHQQQQQQQGDSGSVTVGSEAADSVDVTDQGRVTKNQDPGLPVDAAAIANPEIVALSPHDGSQPRSTSSDQQPLPQQQVNTANEQPGVKVQKLVKALWNLDRIDQRKLPLDGAYRYGTTDEPGTGKGVIIYMVDSGIRTSHQEFQPWGGGRSRARVGPDFVDDDDSADDCDGHGTHVSSTAAGRSVGVAKDASMVGVRVLDCDGAGSISNVVAALDWVGEHAEKPAVASMSLGVPSGMWSRSLETAVKNLVAKGISVVVAAGNSAQDSCKVAPARVPEAMTVGASNLPNKFQQTTAGDTENLYRWSNTGACIDVFAPGVDIYGACGGPSRCESVTDDAYTWASGTSMAAPHVTGLIAVYLEAHPKASPAEIHDALVSAATDGILQSELMLPDTPNRMLFSASQVA